MAIKIRKDGIIQDLVINANEVRVLDKDGNFRSKNLETVLKELNMNGGSGGGTGTGGSGYPSDAEFVYVKDSEPDMDGVWFDESDVSSQPIVGDNSVVKAIREYIDTDVKAIVDKNDKIVQDIKENVGDKLDVVSQLSGNNIIRNGSLDFWVNELTTDCTDKNVEMAKYFHVVGEQSVVVDSAKDVEGLRVTFRNETSNTSNIRSYLDVDFVRSLIGKTLTFSAEYFSEWHDNWDDNVYCFIQDGAVHTDIISTTTIELGNKWKRRIVTFRINNIPNEATEFHIQWFRGNNKNLFGYHLFKNFKLELGEKATNFELKRPDQRIADTFSYNEVISNPNLLINGGFQVWQRGTSFEYRGDIANQRNIYTADRWRLVQSADDVMCSVKQYSDLNGMYFGISNLSKASATNVTLHQKLEPWHLQTGIYTLSYEYYNTGNMKFNSRIYSFGRGYNIATSQEYQPDNSDTWSKGMLVFEITAQDASNIVEISFDMGGGELHTNGTFYLRNVKLEKSSVATPFVPRHYAEELALCKRYYESTLGDVPFGLYFTGKLEGNYNFSVEKRTAPTVTFKHYSDTSTGKMFVFSQNITGLRTTTVLETTTKAVRYEVDRTDDTLNRVGGSAVMFGNITADAEIY